jgi:hypothetical protein
LAAGRNGECLVQSKAFAGDPLSQPEQVAGLLAWSLRTGGTAIQLADCVHEVLWSEPRISTLRRLCRTPPDWRHPEQVRGIPGTIHPESMRAWPDLQCRAYLWCCRGFSARGLWAEMLKAAEGAAAALPGDSEARYWRMRAMLHAGQPIDAERELGAAPGPKTADWSRLSALIWLMAHPTVEAARHAVQLLAGQWGALDDAERGLFWTALETGLLPSPDALDRIEEIATLSLRLQSEPEAGLWCEYNLALKELLADRDYRRAGLRLDRLGQFAGVVPLWMLRAVCALLAGAAAKFASALRDGAEHVVAEELTDDKRFLLALGEALQFGAMTPGAASQLAARLGGPTGPLRQAMPPLAVAGDLLRDLCGLLAGIAVAPTRPMRPKPDMPLWVDWLRAQLEMARAGANGLAPGVPAGRASSTPDLPAGNPVQPLADRVLQVEQSYETGRTALRRGLPDEALTEFAFARTRSDAMSLAGALAQARFHAQLSYWEGVASAHLGRYEAARMQLVPLLGTFLEPDARAQLGMLALARGDVAEANWELAAIPEPRPAAALYLAGILADRTGDQAGAQANLTLVARAESPSPAYRAAALRFLGAEAEQRGDAPAASGLYLEALAAWPADPGAATRLARVSVRRSYAMLKERAQVQAKPVLEELWPRIERLPAGALLRAVWSWLDVAIAGSDPRDDAEGPPLQRLALAMLLAAGRLPDARSLAARWQAQEFPDTARKAAIEVLLASEVLEKYCGDECAPDGRQTVLEHAAGLAELAALRPRDQALAFWSAVAGLLLAEEPAGAAERFALRQTGAGLRAGYRLFASVLGLFSTDPQRRQLAASECQNLLQLDSMPGPAVNLARCLVAFMGSDDEAFLDRYAGFEDNTECLPCPAEDFYLAASEARLRLRRAEEVLVGAIPAELADLARPTVRHAVGLAYAVRAAGAADKDVRKALSDLEQALDMLAEPEDL